MRLLSDASTEIGGPGKSFPKTRWSAIRDATDATSPTHLRSMEEIAANYWRPVYAYLRRKWGHSNEDAKDLTQEFFLRWHEREFLERLSPDRGRFRSYLITALDNFTRIRHRYQTRRKRGGGIPHRSLDVGAGFEPAFEASPEQAFQREWARALLKEAVEELETELRSSGHDREFELFAVYDLDPTARDRMGYEDLAARFDLSLTDVKNALYRTRVKLREAVLRKIRDTVTSDEDVAAEMKELFGTSNP